MMSGRLDVYIVEQRAFRCELDVQAPSPRQDRRSHRIVSRQLQRTLTLCFTRQFILHAEDRTTMEQAR